jgi:hypothetical protein
MITDIWGGDSDSGTPLRPSGPASTVPIFCLSRLFRPTKGRLICRHAEVRLVSKHTNHKTICPKTVGFKALSSEELGRGAKLVVGKKTEV